MSNSPRPLLSLALAAFCLRAGAAVLPPEKLLPKDTVLVLTAPDWNKAKLFWGNVPYAKLWQDPSMKPFKDKFLDKLTNNVIKPLEQNLGINLADYDGLAQGQVTFAIVQVTPKDKSDSPLAGILLLDAKDHAGKLKTSLAQAIKKWTDAGKTMKSQKIRETDFTTLIISPDDLSLKKIFPGVKQAEPPDDAAAKNPLRNMELTVGQSDSLLLVSDSTEAIDKVLSRQSGGMVPPLEESPAFQADYGPRLRGSPFYFWFSAKALLEMIAKPPAGADDDAKASAARMESILSATGLGNLTSASLSYQSYPEGTFAQFFLAVPEEKRPALLKIIAAEAKDSAPPSFVPADAVKYWRWRLNMARSWKSLEAMLNDLVPAAVMMQINAVFQMAGKDKDEHYDLKTELLDNLGDDIIGYEKAAKATKLADLKSPPALYLLGSPNADKLAAAFKVLVAIPFQGALIKDREFLGRKIYTAAPASPGGADAPSGVSFSASGGYLAISSDMGMLEEYLRSSESKSKALMDMPGLADAAQKVGGMGTGLFGFENENQSMRPIFEVFRKHPLTVQDFLGVPLPATAGGDQLESLLQWADFTLLPPYDAVSKYFYFSVYAGSFTTDGFALKMYMPTPPQLRQ
jgi:hypothetical protein